MGDGSNSLRSEAFIRIFADAIIPTGQSSVGDTLEVMEEGLDYLEELREVHYFVKVRSSKKPSIIRTLWSRECLYAPELDYPGDDLLIDRLQDYTNLTKDEIELKLQEASLR